MITFRVYVVNRDTGERRELGVDAYEPGATSLPLSGAFELPPCRCPVCRGVAALPLPARDAC